MISKGQFLDEFDKVCASFGDKKFSKHSLEIWFQEVEYTEHSQFKATMKGLAHGEHWVDKTHAFPRYNDFWKVYQDKAKLFRPKETEVEGCAGCRYGWIHYLKEFDDPPKVYDYVAACKKCQPRIKGAMDPEPDPSHPIQYVPGLEPFRYRGNKILPRKASLGMFQELTDKMEAQLFEGKKIDWNREEIDAWAMSKKAQGAQ